MQETVNKSSGMNKGVDRCEHESESKERKQEM